MPKLFVFFGKPGAGKSTIIHAALSNVPAYDVASIILTGHSHPIQPEVPWNAYQQIYLDILAQPLRDRVMEMGTSYPEFNCAQLKKLTEYFSVRVWLCAAGIPTLQLRRKQKTIPFTEEAFEDRLHRDFPGPFQALVEQEGIAYTLLDTEQPLEQSVAIVKRAWSEQM